MVVEVRRSRLPETYTTLQRASIVLWYRVATADLRVSDLIGCAQFKSVDRVRRTA